MIDLIKYLVVGELIMLSFYLCWRFFLLKSGSFNFNRWWLLGGIAFALMGSVITGLLNSGYSENITFALPAIVMSDMPTAIADNSSSWTGATVFYLIFGTGVLVSVINFILSIRGIFRLRRNSVVVAPGVRELSGNEKEAFSFLGTIYIPQNLEGKDRETCTNHEKIHVAHAHSLDLIVLEIWRAIHWFSPITRYYSKAIKDNHEFCVDEIMLAKHIAKDEYAHTLIRAHQSKLQISLVHSFSNKSSIKNRLKMMYSNKKRSLKYLQLIAIPFFIMAVMVACTKVDTVEEIPMEEVVKSAEVMPEFPGGSEAFMKHMVENIKYPENQKESGLNGTVMVSFVVGKNGEVRDAKVLKSMNQDFDDAALNVVSNMPHWKPGQSDGKAVAVEMVLPVNFVLDDSTE